MMAERDITLTHTTILRWVQRYVPEMERRSGAAGGRTGLRLNDKNEYLYEHPNADTIQQIKRRIKLSKPTTYPG
jgi:transposase-like protein